MNSIINLCNTTYDYDCGIIHFATAICIISSCNVITTELLVITVMVTPYYGPSNHASYQIKTFWDRRM